MVQVQLCNTKRTYVFKIKHRRPWSTVQLYNTKRTQVFKIKCFCAVVIICSKCVPLYHCNTVTVFANLDFAIQHFVAESLQCIFVDIFIYHGILLHYVGVDEAKNGGLTRGDTKILHHMGNLFIDIYLNKQHLYKAIFENRFVIVKLLFKDSQNPDTNALFYKNNYYYFT